MMNAPLKYSMLIGLVLLLAVGMTVVIVVGRPSGWVDAIPEEVDNGKDALLDSLTPNSVLYQKHTHFTPTMGTSEYPSDVVMDTWSLLREDAKVVKSVSKTYDTNGNLVGTSISDNGQTIFTDLIRNESLTTSFSPYRVHEWISQIWAYPQSLPNEEGYTTKGRGSLAGRDSLIYEKAIRESGYAVRREIEVVIDAPLLHRSTSYDSEGVRVGESVWIEYDVLPASSMPTLE